MSLTSHSEFFKWNSGLGSGFSDLRSFLKLSNLLAFILMIIGVSLLTLQNNWQANSLMQFMRNVWRKSNVFPNGDWFKVAFCEVIDSNIVCYKCGDQSKILGFSRTRDENNFLLADDAIDLRILQEEEHRENDEEKISDVKKLRKMVKAEREKANKIMDELEKEQTAAESAAEEAMSMILRLQSEKSSIEIQAQQFRRLAKEKQEYDQDLIRSLCLMIIELKNQLSSYRDDLKEQQEVGDELDLSEDTDDETLSFSELFPDDGPRDLLVGALNISPE